jgi:phage baseplate assembly protein V
MSGSNGMMTRLARRVLLLLGRGRVMTANDAGPAQLVQVQINELETIDNIHRLAEFGFTSMLPRDSDVAIAFIGGDRSNGVIVASNHQPSRPTGLQAGETMIYTLDGKQIYLTASGGIIVKANGQPVEIDGATTVTINAATKIRAVTPRFECTGDIVDNCDSTGRSMAADRVIYDSHTHPVPNVQLGGPGTTTQQPNQSQ